MKPVIALIGRPNVGKSTLFNQITKSRDALVADFAGLTRDRKYGDAVFQNKSFIVVDTGGIGENEGGIDTYIYWLRTNRLHVNCVHSVKKFTWLPIKWTVFMLRLL